MPKLPVGRHITLRYVPRVPQDLDQVKDPGGLYATAKHGSDQPIEVLAREPGVVEYQKWEFDTSSDKGTSIMLIPGEGNSKGLKERELGFNHGGKRKPGTPIVLSDIEKYRIEAKHEVDGDPVVFIHLLGDSGNKDHYVGVSKDNALEIQEFPSGTSEGLPGWFVHASH